jgi:signal transduction histidine kinase
MDKDERIPRYIEATERLKHNDYDIDVPLVPPDELSQLGHNLKDLAAHLEALNDQLRRLTYLKDLFTGVAAHDLRSPVGNIQVSAYLLSTSEDSLYAPENQQFLAEIEKQSQHLLTLLNDLLDVSTMESGQFQLRPETVNLSELLERTLADQRQKAATKSIQVILEPAPALELMADPARLRQVVENLVSHAVKYSPLESQVIVRASQEANRWRLEVRDSGPGLSDVDLEKLFQDFAKLSAKTTSGERNTGLSLSIARRIVHVMGGQIGAESEPGAGTTLWFTLPL